MESADSPSSSTSANICKGDISIFQQIIASSVGALTTSIMVTPMDVVKVRLQQQLHPLAYGECFLYSNGESCLMDHLCANCEDPAKPLSKCEWFNRPGYFKGTIDAFLKIARNEGFRSLWSGLSPTMLSAIPATVFYFTIYDNILCRFQERIGDRIYAPLLSGSLARAAAVSVVSPLELIRTKMQSEKLSYLDLKSAVKRTIAQDGYQALWRGWGATLMRDIPFSAIYWSCYEFSKREFVSLVGREKTNFTISFLCGAGAGTVAAVFTLPFDVVKTHQQITLGQIEISKQLGANNSGMPRPSNLLTNNGNSVSTLNVMKGLIKAKGFSSLFTGIVPRIAKVAPACAIMIGSYEYLKLFFSHQNRLKD